MGEDVVETVEEPSSESSDSTVSRTTILSHGIDGEVMCGTCGSLPTDEGYCPMAMKTEDELDYERERFGSAETCDHGAYNIIAGWKPKEAVESSSEPSEDFDPHEDTCEGCGGQKTPEHPIYGPDGPENGNCAGELPECDVNLEKVVLTSAEMNLLQEIAYSEFTDELPESEKVEGQPYSNICGYVLHRDYPSHVRASIEAKGVLSRDRDYEPGMDWFCGPENGFQFHDPNAPKYIDLESAGVIDTSETKPNVNDIRKIIEDARGEDGNLPHNHSKKTLRTITEMDVSADDWGPCPMTTRRTRGDVPVKVTCDTCNGQKKRYMVCRPFEQEVIPEEVAAEIQNVKDMLSAGPNTYWQRTNRETRLRQLTHQYRTYPNGDALQCVTEIEGFPYEDKNKWSKYTDGDLSEWCEERGYEYYASEACDKCIRKKNRHGSRDYYNWGEWAPTGEMWITIENAPINEHYAAWPEDTLFDSRFGFDGTKQDHQHGCGDDKCEACGKGGIKSGLFPVLGVDSEGKAHGMWVGSSCATNKFGVRIVDVEDANKSLWTKADIESGERIFERTIVTYGPFLDGISLKEEEA